MRRCLLRNSLWFCSQQNVVTADVELSKIGSFEAALLAYVDRDHAPLMQEINQTGGYNDEIEGKLKGILDSFKATQSSVTSGGLPLGRPQGIEEKLMAGAKEIRSKIASVQNTQKITKAMEMVAASKMRKSQDRMAASRPYAETMRKVIGHLAHGNLEYKHPYGRPRR